MWLSMCLLTVLSSRGIVAKCTAIVFFPYGRLETPDLLRPNWNLERFLFIGGEGKTGVPMKNLPLQEREPTANSTHI